jgi:2-dehydro-3-deoxygluconokinase
VTSFDLNYRAKLWAAASMAGAGAAGGSGASAPELLGRIVELTDVLVGNEEDLQMGLGLNGPKMGLHGPVLGSAKPKGEKTSTLDPSAFLGMMEEVREKFPGVKAVASPLREVQSTDSHDWSAVLWLDGQSYVAPTCRLDVYDRVGGGDGFAAGLFYGLMGGRAPAEALALGWAHGALLTTFPGDTSMATLDQVEAFAKGGSARIQR